MLDRNHPAIKASAAPKPSPETVKPKLSSVVVAPVSTHAVEILQAEIKAGRFIIKETRFHHEDGRQPYAEVLLRVESPGIPLEPESKPGPRKAALQAHDWHSLLQTRPEFLASRLKKVGRKLAPLQRAYHIGKPGAYGSLCPAMSLNLNWAFDENFKSLPVCENCLRVAVEQGLIEVTDRSTVPKREVS